MGVEPTPSAWKAEVLPLNYTRADRAPSSRAARPGYTYIFKSCWWRGEDSNLRRLSRQIYSLLPLTAREPLHVKRQKDLKKRKTNFIVTPLILVLPASGASEGNRTPDPLITNQLLCHLSYAGDILKKANIKNKFIIKNIQYVFSAIY